jgi:hypothetical protein
VINVTKGIQNRKYTQMVIFRVQKGACGVLVFVIVTLTRMSMRGEVVGGGVLT